MKTSNKLSALQLPGLRTKPGRHRDGDGLMLFVGATGSASWILRYMIAGKSYELGLGSMNAVNLAEARTRARQAKQAILDGRNPLHLKAEERAASLKVMTFKEAAAAFLDTDKIRKLKNAKHAAQWRSTLEQYAYPKLGRLPLQTIDTKLIKDTLKPLWERAPETCTRVRARIEAVFNYAIGENRFDGLNPARKELFAADFSDRVRRHHAALHYSAVPAFMARLRDNDSVSARALEFTVLCNVRTSDTLGALWDEIDLTAKVWTVPAARLKVKSKGDHRVPLAPRALEILRALAPQGANGAGHVFVNGGGRPLSNMAMLQLLKGMGVAATTHGFRSSFRDWCGDQTAYDRDTIELAMCHVVANKTEAAYRRGDALDKRRRLMAEWAKHLEAPAGQSANVVSLRA